MHVMDMHPFVVDNLLLLKLEEFHAFNNNI